MRFRDSGKDALMQTLCYPHYSASRTPRLCADDVRAAKGTLRSGQSAFGDRRVAEARLRTQVAGVVEWHRELTAGADKIVRPGREQSNLGAQISMALGSISDQPGSPSSLCPRYRIAAT